MPTESSPPAARGYWDVVGAEWTASHRDELWRRCSDAIHAQMARARRRHTAPWRVLKTDLFDEAFGDGLAPWFESRGHDIVACDLAFVDRARRRAEAPTSVAAAVADVRQLPFSKASFDTVFSDSTLDHFGSDVGIRDSLLELHRVLRPGGTLLLTMDNPVNPMVWLRNLSPAFWMRLGIVPYVVGATVSGGTSRGCSSGRFRRARPEAIMHVPRVLMVPLCRWLARNGATARDVDACLAAEFESLDRLPTREMTGHFVAVVARKPS